MLLSIWQKIGAFFQSWKKPSDFRYVARAYAESILIAVVIALLLRFFMLGAFQVPTASMLPTIYPGDFIFAYKLPYGLNIPFSGGKKIGGLKPDRGEVLVFRCPQRSGAWCLKRVVGLPGDRIEIKKKRLWINNQPLDYFKVEKNLPALALSRAVVRERLVGSEAEYLVSLPLTEKSSEFGPQIVPPGHFFALSDNRDHSQDSRQWGPVPLQNIEGRAVLIWLSLDWGGEGGQRSLPGLRWGRLLRPLD